MKKETVSIPSERESALQVIESTDDTERASLFPFPPNGKVLCKPA